MSGVLFLFAMGFALAFVLAVTSLASQAGEVVLARVASASGLLAIALISVYASGFSALAASIPELRDNEHLVYANFRIMSATDDASGVFIAFLVVSVSYALVNVRIAPLWLARFGLLAAVVRAIGVLDVTTLGGEPFAAFMVAGTLLCLVWLVLVGLVLCLRSPAVSGQQVDGGIANAVG